MAKRPCELCQQNLTNDMRFGVYMCQKCINIYSRALHKDPDAIIRLSNPQNYPYATEQAKAKIIQGISALNPYVKNASEETTAQPTQSVPSPASSAVSDPVKNQPVYIPPTQSSLDGMYTDIGKKIKNWAKWVFVISAIAAVITSLIMILGAEYEWMLFLGIVSLFVGPLIAWVSSWILYGFGELIDKTCDNERNTRNILKIMMYDHQKHN